MARCHYARALLVFMLVSVCLSRATAQDCPEAFVPSNTEELTAAIEKVEQQTKNLASDIRSAFSSRCSKIADCECTNWKCSTYPEGVAECSTHGGQTRPSQCAATTCDGINVNKGGISVDWAGRDALDRKQEELICGTRDAQDKFVKVHQELEGTLYAYFGSYNGVIVEWPGSILDCAIPYDPRIRPWYRAGSSGPKDVVIVVDVSGSMDTLVGSGGTTRLELVKRALGQPNGPESGQYGLLDMFGHSDYVSVVTFSSEANIVGDSTNLQRGTVQNLGKLKQQVAAIDPQTTTNFLAGFEKAFDVFKTSLSNEVTSQCKRVVVFLTDGVDSNCNDGDSNSAEKCGENDEFLVNGTCRCQQGYLERIQELQDDLVATAGGEKANIFTYSMGAASDDSLPRMIACDNDGAWAQIDDGEDPLSEMSVFFSFLARNAQADTVYWSEPFQDWTTDTILSTAVSPVIDKGHLVGVAAIDVPPSVLAAKYSNSNELPELSRELQARSRECADRKLDLTPCEFQLLRLGQQTGDVEEGFGTCAADLSGANSCCVLAPDNGVTYFLHAGAMDWDSAKSYCTAAGGKLATVGADDAQDLHMLAGMAPPDGAWVGLMKSGGQWQFDGRGALDAKVWAHPPEDEHEVAFVNPRGSIGNMKSFEKTAKKSFICEFPDTECPAAVTADCSRSSAGSVLTAADVTRKSSQTCLQTTETVIKACDEDVSADNPICAERSSLPWANSRSQGLCCAEAEQPATPSSASESTVRMTVRMPYSKAEFEAAAVQGAFKRAVATTAGVTADKVVIESVSDVTRRMGRSLLAGSADVTFTVNAGSKQRAEELVDELDLVELNKNMAVEGVSPISSITEEPALVSGGGSSSNVGVIAGAAVGGVVFVVMIVALFCYCRSKSSDVPSKPAPPAVNPNLAGGGGPQASGPPMPEASGPPMPDGFSNQYNPDPPPPPYRPD